MFDATCPLVTKVHMQVTRYAREAREVVLIGHAGHPEVEGTMGQFDSALGGRILLVETPEDVAGLEIRDPARLAFVTQTTLSVDDTARVVEALRARFPELVAPRNEDICYATQNRQDAVKTLVEECDIVIVVGSRSSSNSNRLREIAEKAGLPGYLVDGPEDLQREWFVDRHCVGVTAGASAPEVLVRRVVERSGLGWNDAAPFAPGQTLGEALMTPTRIYVKSVLPLIKAGLIKGGAHITGGGIADNFERVLPKHVQALSNAEPEARSHPRTQSLNLQNKDAPENPDHSSSQNHGINPSGTS